MNTYSTTPYDSGNIHHDANVKPEINKEENKRPTSFNLDKAMVARFKARCATNGCSMSSVIENLINEYLSEETRL